MSATNRGALRDDLGRYYTEPELARGVVARMLTAGILAPGKVVLEPHVGGGVWIDALLDVTGWAPGEVTLLALDLDPDAPALRVGGGCIYEAECLDYLVDYPADWPKPDVVLGNPPYSVVRSGKAVEVARAHVERGFALGVRDSVYVLRTAFLEGPTGRRPFWRSHPPRETWHLWPRPSFTGGSSDMAAYSAFWWHAGWGGPWTSSFLEWRV